MNRKTIILSFLLFISLGAFSQNIFNKKENTTNNKKSTDESGIGNITRDSLRDCSLELTEAKDQIDLLQKYVKKIRNPRSEIDSSTLLNTGKYYALIIAVQHYKNKENFPDLEYTIRDAEALQTVLEENYIFEQIDILIDPEREAIMRQLSGLREATANTDNDNVLIFYAGHGSKWDTPDMKDGYWCPTKAELQRYESFINNSDIKNYIRLIGSRNTLLISDACWAGSMRERKLIFGSSAKTSNSDVLQDKYDKKSRFYMSSGAETTVPDESVFMKYLLKELKNNTDRYLSSSDLFDRIKKPTEFNAPRSNGKIVTPEHLPIHNVGHEGGEFFFIKKIK